jgi:hypothetical protein
MAGVLMAIERPQLAVRVLGSVQAFRSGSGFRSRRGGGRQATYDRTVAGLLELLGRQTYAAAWSEGSKLSIDQAVAEVLATWAEPIAGGHCVLPVHRAQPGTKPC